MFQQFARFHACNYTQQDKRVVTAR
jgi:hypothetical protein